MKVLVCILVVFMALLSVVSAFISQSRSAAAPASHTCSPACGCTARIHTCSPACGCSGRSSTSLSAASGVPLPELLSQNNEWAKAITAEDPTYFTELAKGQSPKYLWIGCVDSRVPAEIVTQSDPGQLFVHRNIANQAVGFDSSFASCLEYAVDYLGVEDIIVCGHYECGGVKAASGADKLGDLENWLIHIRQVVDINKATLDQIEDADEKHRKTVDFNVEAQVLKLYANPVILRHMEKNGKAPKIHGLVFDIKTGTLNKVFCDMAKLPLYVANEIPQETQLNEMMAPKKKRGFFSWPRSKQAA